MMHQRRLFPLAFGSSCLGALWWSWGGGKVERSKALEGGDASPRLSIEWWEEKWNLRQTGWRRGEAGRPFPANIAQTSALLGKAEQDYRDKRALVPLCGDSRVLVFLAETYGMHVTGVDGSQEALKVLEEQLQTVPAAIRARIHLIHHDFLDPAWTAPYRTPEQAFDFVYDRFGLVAVDPANRAQYVKILSDVTKPGSFGYLEGVMRSPVYTGKPRGKLPPSNLDYPPWINVPNVVRGPPHHLPPSDLPGLFAGWKTKVSDQSMQELLESLSDPSTPYDRYCAALAKDTA